MAWDGAGALPEFLPFSNQSSGWPRRSSLKVATLGTTGYPTMKNQAMSRGWEVQPGAAGELIAEDSARVLLAHLVGDAGRERIEADMIAGPAWTLERRAFSAAGGAACASAQFVA